MARTHTAHEAAGSKKEGVLTSIPDLGLHRLSVDVDTPSRKLYTNRRLGFEVEFVAGKSREHWS